jgi:hypothetical protein
VARPRTIFVDPDTLLVNICNGWKAILADLEAGLPEAERALAEAQAAHGPAWEAWVNGPRGETAGRNYHLAAERVSEARAHLRQIVKRRDDFLAAGLQYDLLAFLGRSDVSPSERLRANQALRRMEAEGLVTIYGQRATRIWPTDEGLARAAELSREAVVDAT